MVGDADASKSLGQSQTIKKRRPMPEHKKAPAKAGAGKASSLSSR
jgi:hypothetical protein